MYEKILPEKTRENLELLIFWRYPLFNSVMYSSLGQQYKRARKKIENKKPFILLKSHSPVSILSNFVHPNFVSVI